MASEVVVGMDMRYSSGKVTAIPALGLDFSTDARLEIPSRVGEGIETVHLTASLKLGALSMERGEYLGLE